MKLRYARKTGAHPEARIMWDGECTDGWKLHSAGVRYAEDYTGDTIPDGWRDVHPTSCDRCGAPFDVAGEHSHSGTMRLEWNTDSGQLEPGCVWIIDHRDKDWCPGRWSNCDGLHVNVILPNGHSWDVHSRARNCGLPDDTTHRCWVLVGDPEKPETLDVSKAGETCAAGAGSIQAGDYHGFLRSGELVLA